MHWNIPENFFWICETKKFERKDVIPTLSDKIKKPLVELLFLDNLRKLDFELYL